MSFRTSEPPRPFASRIAGTYAAEMGRGENRESVLAEIERANQLLTERILHELGMAGFTEIEAKSLVHRRGDFIGREGLVALQDLGDRFHVVLLEIVLRELGRIEAGEGFDLDDESRVAGNSQVFPAEITREVDHQRLIPQ